MYICVFQGSRETKIGGGAIQKKPAMSIIRPSSHSGSLVNMVRKKDTFRPGTSSSVSTSSDQVLVWIYTQPKNVFVLNVNGNQPKNFLGTLNPFVQSKLSSESTEYDLKFLGSGSLNPMYFRDFKPEMMFGVILCLPKEEITIEFDVKEFSDFQLAIFPMNKVKDLKEMIQEAKGFPKSLINLILDGQPLKNNDIIIDTGLQNETKVQLTLEPAPDFWVYVKTFWGAAYTILINPCLKVEHILQIVFRKAISKGNKTPELTIKQMCPPSLYRHLIFMVGNYKALQEQDCVNHFGIHKGDTIHILSTAEVRSDTNVEIIALVENAPHISDGNRSGIELQASIYDTWFMVALKVHGKTKIPLDCLKLYFENEPLKLETTIGKMALNEVLYISFRAIRPPRVSTQILFDVKLICGMIQTVPCNFTDSVADLKATLYNDGVKDVYECDVMYKQIRMPLRARFSEFKFKNNKPVLDLKMTDFPVHIGHGTKMGQVRLKPSDTLMAVLLKVQATIGDSAVNKTAIFAGVDLQKIEYSTVKQTSLYLHSHLILEPAVVSQVLRLVVDKEVIPILVKFNIENIQARQLKKLCNNPEIVLRCIQWFTCWRYPDFVQEHSSYGNFRSQSVMSANHDVAIPQRPLTSPTRMRRVIILKKQIRKSSPANGRNLAVATGNLESPRPPSSRMSVRSMNVVNYTNSTGIPGTPVIMPVSTPPAITISALKTRSPAAASGRRPSVAFNLARTTAWSSGQ